MILQELINQLDVPDTDYWYNSGCEVARKIIDENCEEIFDLIISTWRGWPELQQVHLAYILGEGSSPKEFTIINELLTSQFDNVVFRAKEALNNFGSKT